MTHTTTEAAEARAREVLKETALRVSDDIFTNNYGEPQVIAAMLAFATAEAASGAGEREDALEAAARAMCDRVNGIGDYDENIGQRRTGWLAQAKAGIAAYLASLPPATAPAMVTVPREPTEAMIAAWFDAPRPAEVDFRPAYRAMLAAAPLATNPVIPSEYKLVPVEITDEMARAGSVAWLHTRPHVCLAREHAFWSAALAAAPTIPATGEAIPEGMKPWHGGNGPPNDWDGGEVLLENEQMGDGNVWDHHPSRSPSRIVAYTPKASIPATGHASTVDPDDLRPWGYAPGEYLFRCIDCPPDRQIVTRTIGDKRSWRCKPHAEAARDASGHAATEGEGA